MAIARPMPRFPPVTNATLPRIENLSRIDIGGLTSSGGRRASCAFAKGRETGCPPRLRRRVALREPTSANNRETVGPLLEVGLPRHGPHCGDTSVSCRCKLIYQSSTLSKDGLSKARAKAYQAAQRINDAFRSARAYSGQTCVFEVESKSRLDTASVLTFKT